jgi:hypothetical protein
LKTLIKLAIVALVANATWRVGSEYLSFYRFKDAVQETTQLGGRRSDAQLRSRIVELASNYDIPVDEESLTVTRRENHIIVDTEFKKRITLAPGFQYEWPFTLHVDTINFDSVPGR